MRPLTLLLAGVVAVLVVRVVLAALRDTPSDEEIRARQQAVETEAFLTEGPP